MLNVSVVVHCVSLGMDQFDRDSTIADFKNGVTKLMVSVTVMTFSVHRLFRVSPGP